MTSTLEVAPVMAVPPRAHWKEGVGLAETPALRVTEPPLSPVTGAGCTTNTGAVPTFTLTVTELSEWTALLTRTE